MKDLGHLLIGLLGGSADDAEFVKLLGQLGRSSTSAQKGLKPCYRFDQLGFAIQCDKDRFVYAVTFHFATRGVKDKTIRIYEMDLPFGLKTTDRREEVERKIGAKPQKVFDTKDGTIADCPDTACDSTPIHVEKYELQPYEYCFIFNSNDGRLIMLGVSRFSRRSGI